METIKAIALLALATFAALLLRPVLTAAIGALAAIGVSWFFPATMGILTTLITNGVGVGVAPYQVGAMLGFVGGFFRASVSTSSSK